MCTDVSESSGSSRVSREVMKGTTSLQCRSADKVGRCSSPSASATGFGSIRAVRSYFTQTSSWASHSKLATSHPRDATTTEAKRRIRSHAAKDVHATRRSAKAKREQAGEEDTKGLGEPTPTSTDPTPVRGEDISTQPEAQGGRELDSAEALVLVRPANLLDCGREDPFQSFVRPMTRTEQFLIDHCKSIPRIRPSLLLPPRRGTSNVNAALCSCARCHLCHSARMQPLSR